LFALFHPSLLIINLVGLHYALWWQIKLYGEETKFSWHEVQGEIDLVPILADHQCLVIASTQVSPGIAAHIGDSTHLWIPPGVYGKGEGKKGDLLNVPNKLEVVILGPKGLTQLYSEYDLDGLHHLACTNTFASISKHLTKPTVPLAGGISLTPMPAPTPGKLNLQYIEFCLFSHLLIYITQAGQSN
jgi:hypothetical protein